MPVRASPREGPIAAAAVALAALAAAWTGLYEGVRWPHVAGICIVAALPALATALSRGRAVAVAVAVLVALPVVLAMALRHSVWDYVGFDGEAWRDARAVLPDGLRSASDAGLPVSFGEHPEMVALLDLALAALAATIAWQLIARRRPVAALLALGVGLAYRWTVEPPDNGVLAGALALVAVAAVLALAAWDGGSGERAARRAAAALALGGVAVVVGAALGAGPVQADEPWWAWKTWQVGSGGAEEASALDLRQQYGVLDWPTTPRVALTVGSESNLPLRAAALEDFDGVSFLADPADATGAQTVPIVDHAIELDPGAGSAGPPVSQRVTLVGASSQVLLSSGRPRRIEGPFAGTARVGSGAVQVAAPLEPGDSYIVRTALPRPRPAELVEAPPYDPVSLPADSTRLRAGYGSDPVDIPAWGSGDPGPDDYALGPYARVRELARRVVGDAATPYAAVNRVESFLRKEYIYDEAPPYPTSLPDGTAGPADRPPIVDFLFVSRRGFCQHFAGAMAAMLRSIGIPSRVAVGYGAGHWDNDRKQWVVLDRDAHSWVEVWFPDHGWLPFDPTPGRSAPNPASVSSPDYAPSAFDIDLGGIEKAAVAPTAPDPARQPDPAPEQQPQQQEAASSSGGRGGGSPWPWALLALVVPVLAIPAARAARRARARGHGDERTRVIAAARDLESSLRALGWEPPAAGAPSERAADVLRMTGVDPSDLYGRAARARYGHDPLPDGSGAAAWREAGRLRRAIRRRASLGRRARAAFAIRPRRGTVVT